jgi:hypothetical protein
MALKEPVEGEAVAGAVGQLARAVLGGDPATGGLIADLISRNYRDYAATTQALISTQERIIARLQVTLDLIRTRIESAYDKPWIPSQDTILGALYPEVIEAMIEERQSDRGWNS